MGSREKQGEFTWVAISRARGIEGRTSFEKLEREGTDEQRMDGWMDGSTRARNPPRRG